MKKQLLALAFSCLTLWGTGEALAAKPTEWSLLGENKHFRLLLYGPGLVSAGFPGSVPDPGFCPGGTEEPFFHPPAGPSV